MGVLRNLATLVFVLAYARRPGDDDDPRRVQRAAHLHVRRRRVQRRADHAASRAPSLCAAGDELRHYLNSSDEDAELRIQVVQDNIAAPLFNSREASHLKDVRDRIIWRTESS